MGDLLNKWHETKWKNMNWTWKEKEINGRARTWQETQKSMEFVHSGGYEAV